MRICRIFKTSVWILGNADRGGAESLLLFLSVPYWNLASFFLGHQFLSFIVFNYPTVFATVETVPVLNFLSLFIYLMVVLGLVATSRLLFVAVPRLLTTMASLVAPRL